MKVDTEAENNWIASHKPKRIITSFTLDCFDVTMKSLLFTKLFKWFNVTTNFKEERNTHSEFIRVVYPMNFSDISWREQVNLQWNDDEVRLLLDQHDLLDLYSASRLKQPADTLS